MTKAHIVHTVPSREQARVFLAQARRLIADASSRDVSAVGQQLLLYQGCIAACDAALIAVGKKVEGSEGGHRLRIEETAAVMALDDDLHAALDDARAVRAGSAYEAGFVTEADLSATREAAGRLLAEADAFIARDG